MLAIARFNLGEPVSVLWPHMVILADAVRAEQPFVPFYKRLVPNIAALYEPFDAGDDLSGRPGYGRQRLRERANRTTRSPPGGQRHRARAHGPEDACGCPCGLSAMRAFAPRK
jgi:hypothetical protein